MKTNESERDGVPSKKKKAKSLHKYHQSRVFRNAAQILVYHTEEKASMTNLPSISAPERCRKSSINDCIHAISPILFRTHPLLPVVSLAGSLSQNHS